MGIDNNSDSLQSGVTVVIVTWNAEEYIVSCIESLISQERIPDKIVIVDNNSSDSTIEKLEVFKRKVHVVSLPTNTGFAYANNFAIKQHVSTEYVALINPDAIASRGWLRELLNCAQAQPEESFFASRQLDFSDNSVLDGDGDALHLSGLAWRRGYGKHATSFNPKSLFFSPCGASAMYKTKDFLDVGGFDQDFFCYFEDVDLVYRMRLLGLTGQLVSEAVVKHVGSAASGGRHSDFAIYHGHRNLVWSFVKNTPAVLLCFLLLPHILMNLLFVFRYAVLGRSSVIIRSKLDALKGLRKMWVKRDDIQRRRELSSYQVWSALSLRGVVDRC